MFATEGKGLETITMEQGRVALHFLCHANQIGVVREWVGNLSMCRTVPKLLVSACCVSESCVVTPFLQARMGHPLSSTTATIEVPQECFRNEEDIKR